MREVTLGVLGCGRIGRLHAENALLLPGVRLVAVADPRFATGLDEPPGVERTSRVEEVIADPRIEAVLVCTPTPSHAELIVAAAAAGRHVFCEKPIDLDPGVAAGALAAVEAAGVKLQIGFNRRFDPSFRRVHDAIRAGEIGELCALRVISRDPSPPDLEYVRSSGGLFHDMTIHDFDLLRFLSGREVEEVHAFAAVRVDRRIGEAGDVDTAILSLRLAGGVLATIENSRRAVYGYDQRLEAFGSSGAIEAGNRTASTTAVKTACGTASESPLPFFVERYAEAYRAELAAFLAAIRDDVPTPVSGRDGLAPLWIARAAERSLATGRPERVTVDAEA